LDFHFNSLIKVNNNINSILNSNKKNKLIIKNFISYWVWIKKLQLIKLKNLLEN